MATSFVPHGRQPVPGPTRRFDRRHFARVEGGGLFAVGLCAAVFCYCVGVGFGFFPSVFR